jgi:hypothetical protein
LQQRLAQSDVTCLLPSHHLLGACTNRQPSTTITL